MNENNGWPGKPGIPLNPERDDWHWLRHDEIDQEEAALWNAKGNFWQLMGADATFSPRDLVVRKWGYVGPVLSHDQVTALQKRVAELEKALRDLLPEAIDHRYATQSLAVVQARAVLEGGKDG